MKQKHTGIKASSMNSGPVIFLLDDYPGAGAAYSVRKLDSNYSGDCMEITRASDSTTQNIGFDGSGDLDTAAINSFCTGTTCYVTVWYDQGPNGYDLSSNSGDWSIYESGNVVTKNGRPAIKNVDPGVNLEASGVNIAHLVGSNAFYGIVVGTYQANAADIGTYYVSTSSAGIYALGHGYNFAAEEVFMYLGFSSGSYGTSPINTGDQEIIEGLKVSSSQDDVYINGVQIDSGNPYSASWAPTGTEDLLIGGGTISAPCESIQEVILYPSNQNSNRANIYANVSGYYY